MSRGARAVARLLAGAPATSVNLDDLDADWRPLAEVLLHAPDRGAALEAALAQRPDGDQRWAELLTADVLSPDGDQPERTSRLLTVEELEQLPAPRWLVHNHLVAKTISVLFDPFGVWHAASRHGARPTATHSVLREGHPGVNSSGGPTPACAPTSSHRPNRTSLTNATKRAVVDSACGRHKASSPDDFAAGQLALGGRSRRLAGCPRTHGRPLDSLGPSARESDRRRSVQGDSRRGRTSRRGPRVESRAAARSHPTTSQGGSNSARVLTPLTPGLAARTQKHPRADPWPGSARGCS